MTGAQRGSPLSRLRIRCAHCRVYLVAAVLFKIGCFPEGRLHRIQPKRAHRVSTEGLAPQIPGERAAALSAASGPSTANPLAIEVMSKIGIDIAGRRSKFEDTIDPAGRNLAGTLCAAEACPVLPNRVRRLHGHT